MNTKTSVVFSIIAIAAAALLFAVGPVTTHQAHAWGGWGGGCGGWGGGCGGWGGFGGCGGWGW